MPCYDPPPTHAALNEEIRELRERERFLEASLCGALKALAAVLNVQPQDVVKSPAIDYDDAGIPKEQLAAWWSHHLAHDADRKRLRAMVAELHKESAEGLVLKTPE